MEQVENIALGEQADHVTAIHLGIGALSGVEPRLLEQAFSIARAGTIAADADLIIKSMPVQVSCSQCGRQSEVLPNRLLCGHCGDWRTSLVRDGLPVPGPVTPRGDRVIPCLLYTSDAADDVSTV